MTRKITDPRERKALLWEAVRIMIYRFGSDWQYHLNSVCCDIVEDLLAPLGPVDEWASLAVENIEQAWSVGDMETVKDRKYILRQIRSPGVVIAR